MARMFFLTVTIVCIFAWCLSAHPGRTDSSGGHRDSKTGTYHSHSGSSSTSSSRKGYPVTPSNPTPAPFQNRPEPEYPIRSSPPASKPLIPKVVPTITENHWQVLLNKKCFNGKMEVACDAGQIDIATDKLVIEVERVGKFKEGFEKVKKYAWATKKSPVLALFIDGDPEGLYQLDAARKESLSNGIPIVLANASVSIDDFFQTIVEATKEDATYWIDNAVMVRHNAACHHFRNTASGREGAKSEGKPCSICGG